MIDNDPLLLELQQQVLQQFGELAAIKPPSSDQYFGKLAESIIGQQLSTKVADVIEARARVAVGGVWQPEFVLATAQELLRTAGLSNAKVSYLHNVAEAFSNGSVNADELATLDDEAVIERLIQIKGVGRWTVEMFLIFTLARPDIFSVGDYGLRKAICKLYNLDIITKPAELLTIAAQWQPERSLASRILWKSLELPK